MGGGKGEFTALKDDDREFHATSFSMSVLIQPESFINMYRICEAISLEFNIPVQDFIVTKMTMGEITPYIRWPPDFVGDKQAATK